MRRKDTVSASGTNPFAMTGGQCFVGGRSVSAKAPNGMRSSARTLGPFRSAVIHHARPSTSCPRRRWARRSGAPWRRRSARLQGRANRPRRAPPHSGGARFRLGRRSLRHLLVAVVVTPPDALFVAPFWGAVEPLVHAPEPVQSAGIGRIGMIDDAVIENESAEARPLAHIRSRLGSSPGRVLDNDWRKRRRRHRVTAATVIVFGAPVALLLLGDRDVEVVIEVATPRRRPGKGPAHPLFERLQLPKRRAGCRQSITSWLARC